MDRRANPRPWAGYVVLAVVLIAVMVWLVVAYQVPQRIVEAVTDRCGEDAELMQAEDVPEAFVPWEESELASADWDEEDAADMERVLEGVSAMGETFDATPMMAASEWSSMDDVFEMAEGTLGLNFFNVPGAGHSSVLSYDMATGDPVWGTGPEESFGQSSVNNSGYQVWVSRDLPGDVEEQETLILDPATGEERDCFSGPGPAAEHRTEAEQYSEFFNLGKDQVLTSTMDPLKDVPQRALYQYGADEETWAEGNPGPMRAFDQESGETQWEYPRSDDGVAYAFPVDVVESEQGEQRIIAARAELPEEDSVHGAVSSAGDGAVTVDGEPVFNERGEAQFAPNPDDDPQRVMTELELDWSLAVLDAEGEELWIQELSSSPFFGAAEAYGDTLVHAGATSGAEDPDAVMRGFDLDTGETLWTDDDLDAADMDVIMHPARMWQMLGVSLMDDRLIWRSRAEDGDFRAVDINTGDSEVVENGKSTFEIKAVTDTHFAVETGDRYDGHDQHVVIFERN